MEQQVMVLDIHGLAVYYHDHKMTDIKLPLILIDGDELVVYDGCVKIQIGENNIVLLRKNTILTILSDKKIEISCMAVTRG